MNDDRKLKLERFFDGELPDDERVRVEHELTTDPEAAGYVGHLERLRTLARQSDPIDAVASRRLAPGPWLVQPMRRRWGMAVSGGLVAAGIVATIWLVGRGLDRADHADPFGPTVVVHKPIPEPSVAARKSRVADDVPLELDAQRYEWANGELATPAAAARVVIDEGHRRGQRSSSELEILAIELANSPDDSPRDVGRVVAERTTPVRQPPLRGRTVRKPGHATPPGPRGVIQDGASSRSRMVV